jgi:hypothetical protein
MAMLSTDSFRTLASVGAAIILLSLPLDLFFQQIVEYPTVWQNVPTVNATMSRSVFYNPNLNIVYLAGALSLPTDPLLDGMSYQFFVGHGQNEDVGFSCPTNNCTFAPFYTLALKSSCVEMPTLLTPGCRSGPSEWISTVSNGNIAPGFTNGTSCGWYLNSMVGNSTASLPNLMSGYETKNGTKGEALAMRVLPLRDPITRRLVMGQQSLNFPDIQNPVADFIIASTPDGIAGAYKNNTPVVHECAVYWTVQLLNSTVFDGVVTENVLETHLLQANNTGPLWYTPLSYGGNFSMALPETQKQGAEMISFGMNNYTARKTAQMWEEFAPSSWFGVNETDSLLKAKWQWRLLPAHVVNFPPGPNFWLPPNNLSEYMDRMMAASNRLVRKTENYETVKTDAIAGQAWKQIVIVDIRWIWISLPAALLFFSSVFLIATIVKSTKEEEKVGVWKTSALAVLFNGLGDDVQRKVGASQSLGTTRARAKDLKVRLDDD